MNSIKYIFVLLLFISCKKDKTTTEETKSPGTFQAGILVLNEGLFQQNNSSLSWIDAQNKEVVPNIFLEKNNRLLGDTGNDLKRYGGKVYVVINSSSTVEILDSRNLKSVKRVNLIYNGQGQQPRSIAFWKNKAYISSYDGFVNILDTATLSIKDRIQVGQNPEGLIVLDNFLYVSNSGGLNFPDVDSTVFKIDLNSNVIADTFVVGKNPGDIIAHQNDLFVVKRGDYGSNPSELIHIDLITGNVQNLGIPATKLSKKEEKLYISFYDYNANTSNVALYDMQTLQTLNQNLIDNNQITTLYGAYPYMDDKIICLDAMNFTNTGYLKIFNSNGSLEESFEVGLNPNNIIIYE